MRIAMLGRKIALAIGALGLAALTLTAAPALAATANCNPDTSSNPIQNGASCAQANGTSSNLFAQGGVFQVASNTLIFIVGAVAVIFLIIGGLRYVISNGDPKNVEAAKNTILYAIVGIVVAIISFALVQFVINALNKAS
jgi:hypothetical protein